MITVNSKKGGQVINIELNNEVLNKIKETNKFGMVYKNFYKSFLNDDYIDEYSFAYFYILMSTNEFGVFVYNYNELLKLLNIHRRNKSLDRTIEALNDILYCYFLYDKLITKDTKIISFIIYLAAFDGQPLKSLDMSKVKTRKDDNQLDEFGNYISEGYKSKDSNGFFQLYAIDVFKILNIIKKNENIKIKTLVNVYFYIRHNIWKKTKYRDDPESFTFTLNMVANKTNIASKTLSEYIQHMVDGELIKHTTTKKRYISNKNKNSDKKGLFINGFNIVTLYDKKEVADKTFEDTKKMIQKKTINKYGKYYNV